MSPRKQIEETDARERILAAAAEVFASVGFTGARVDDIAERAGINKAMLYYHVGDKERLYATVLINTVERGLATLTESTAKAKTPSEKLQCILEAFGELGSSNPHLIPIMLREVASGGATLPDEMLVRMAGVFRVVQEVLLTGVQEGVFRPTDPLLTHVSLVGCMMFLVASQPIRARLGKIAGIETRHTLRDLADHTANLFLHGLEYKAPEKGAGPSAAVEQPKKRGKK